VTITLPSYLADPVIVDGRTYGRLVHRAEDRLWEIRGEPQVTALAKRLFPGSRSSGRRGDVGAGAATFPLTPRLVRDLAWLMQRFPLEIDAETMPIWTKAIEAAREHETRSIEIRRRPASIDAGATFAGELLPFQREGVAFLTHHRRCLLADEMGLGKTVQALAALSALPPEDAWPALIVCQSHVVRQWCRMVERFIPGRAITVLTGMRPDMPLPTPMTVIHYGLLRAWGQTLSGEFRTVIFDECQELRHTGTQKYTAASVIGDHAAAVWGLSGTPIHNTGGEIWAVLNILETHCLGDWHSFTREWCYGYGSDVVSDPKKLGHYLAEEGLCLRRRKADVLEELPPKRRVVEEIDGETGRFGEIAGALDQLVAEHDAAVDHLERGRKVREIVERARRATGLAKAPFVADFAAALLEAGEPGIVFAHHHAVVDEIVDRLRARDHAVEAIGGRETQREKDDRITRFRDNALTCLVISLRTTAGLDGLQERARWCVFAELDWSPAVHAQAEDRLHRIGQHDSVLAYYLVWPDSAAGSVDPDIMDRLGFKASQFSGLMLTEGETNEDRMLAQESATEHMRTIVDRLRDKRRKAGAA
jgi:SWI/SNF-related matrix-associated actin-dependent regulator 1 of chromatin subfamily A